MPTYQSVAELVNDFAFRFDFSQEEMDRIFVQTLATSSAKGPDDRAYDSRESVESGLIQLRSVLLSFLAPGVARNWLQQVRHGNENITGKEMLLAGRIAEVIAIALSAQANRGW
ncbi:hypothetical protein EPN83_01700 [Patescibacteria group bacterium]|nr:MAG: hypothetical protein EPN83_01700 [Patescibacteria group bacterium]